MTTLDNSISIHGVYARSVNLQRDSGDLSLLRAYLPTAKARQTLARFQTGLTKQPAERSFALIGPYGSGKSAFALFLCALLGPGPCPARACASHKLKTLDPTIAAGFDQAVANGIGFLKISVNGTPDSLIRQLLLALADSLAQAGFDAASITDIRQAAHPATPMATALAFLKAAQDGWAARGGAGVLLTLDELGKCLEYEAHHPQHREIHLLQGLAEQARQSHDAPLHVVVLLHQAFEYYAHKLGKPVRDEWQKIQGRFNPVAFLEPVEQTLKVLAAAFVQHQPLAENVLGQISGWTARLHSLGALPQNLTETQARSIFQQCYPLHPVSLLILPVLCQKIAQNERTLFAYLGSAEPLGLKTRLGQLAMGEWIEPAELYDFFIAQQMGGFTDPLTYRRWLEVVTALERFDAGPEAQAVSVLKTIGLLNLIGGQRGLKASPELLRLLFGDGLGPLLSRLTTASVIHFRQYSQDYRVWQGSDFDLDSALASLVAEMASQPLAPMLNEQSPIPPIVARRASIDSGSLRSFTIRFASKTHPHPPNRHEPNLLIYLCDDNEHPEADQFKHQDVVALCGFAQHERLRETLLNKLALEELPKRHAALHQDPVARREHLAWQAHADMETADHFSGLLAEPDKLTWCFSGKQHTVPNRRDLQKQLSEWLEHACYPKAPKLRNELIVWEHPSASANTGRNRLIQAMLTAPNQDDLGISKTPAEKSLYLSLLKASRLHRQENGILGIYPPDEHDPCKLRPVWDAITCFLGGSGKQTPVSEVYRHLQNRPFGIKQGVLPVLLIAYLLSYRREVALYQEGAYCAQLAPEQAELLCKRPEFFSLERFDLGGLRGELFDHYLHSVVGNIRTDATLLDIAKPLVQFAGRLPEYTKKTKYLSQEAIQVLAAFTQAQSPGALLFDALPQALGLSPADCLNGEPALIEPYIQALVGVLRELQSAYEQLLNGWQTLLSQTLLQQQPDNLADLRQHLSQRYGGLEAYTPDKMGLAAFIRRLCDQGYPSDLAWLESTAALLGKAPPQKWTESHRIEAEYRLKERAGQLNALEALRMALPDKTPQTNAVMISRVDAERGEIRRVISQTPAQRQTARDKAEIYAKSLELLDENERLAILSELIGSILG